MKNPTYIIPESDLVFSSRTFSENPAGSKACITGSIAFIIALLYVLLSHGISRGVLCHVNFIIIKGDIPRDNETILRLSVLPLLSTKALLLSMPVMSFVLVAFTVWYLLRARHSDSGGFPVAVAFALVVFTLIAVSTQLPMAADILFDVI
ncbi:MAG: hypothetical protein JW863_16185 [Chitinispirillaceae bacterium]|nr:hypothetical protein [Chitinispirillaceae bacterium]